MRMIFIVDIVFSLYSRVIYRVKKVSKSIRNVQLLWTIKCLPLQLSITFSCIANNDFRKRSITDSATQQCKNEILILEF